MKKRTTTNHSLAVAPTVRIRPTYAEREDFLRRRMDGLVEAGKGDAEEFAGKVSKSLNDAVYAISWLSGAVETMVLGEIAEEALSLVESKGITLETAVRKICEELSRKLSGNGFSTSSSSAFSNAVEAARREAAHRFVDQCGYPLDALAVARAEEYLL